MTEKTATIRLALNNEVIAQKPYNQHFLDWPTPPKRGEEVSRRQAIRSCYWHQVNFMKFMRDCPDQQDKDRIDGGRLLDWIEQECRQCA